MTTADFPSGSQGQGGMLRQFFVWFVNFVAFIALFVTAGFFFFALIGMSVTSGVNGASFFDPSGWFVLLAMALTIFLAAPLSALIKYRDWNNGEYAEDVRVPYVWQFNMFLAAAAVICFALTAWITNIPLQVRVEDGYVLMKQDGTIYTQGESVTASRFDREFASIPLTNSTTMYVRAPVGEAEHITVALTVGFDVVVNDDLREATRAHPPNFRSDTLSSDYFPALFMPVIQPDITQIILDEARPGNTTIGEVSGWSRDQASVPMSDRLGLRVQERRDELPSWLPRVSFTNMQVREWTHEQQS